MEISITTKSIGMQSEELHNLLINTLKTNDEVKFELRRPEVVFRGVESMILVAIVGAVGTGLGALITGLLQIAKQKAGQRITIQTKSGSRIQVPPNVSPEMLDTLIDKIKKLEDENLKVTIS